MPRQVRSKEKQEVNTTLVLAGWYTRRFFAAIKHCCKPQCFEMINASKLVQTAYLNKQDPSLQAKIPEATRDCSDLNFGQAMN